MNHAVYRIKWSIEDGRPQINFDSPKNQGASWTIAGDIVRDERNIDEYTEIEATVSAANASNYHCYLDGIGPGFYSDEVVSILRPHGKNAIRFLPVSLNGARYWLPKFTNRVNAFDRDKSKFTCYRHDPERVMLIDAFAFKSDLITDPLVFGVPEEPFFLLITQSIYEQVLAKQFRGIDLVKLWQCDSQ